MTDIKEDCCCKNLDCPRHGKCRECIEFHLEKGNKPPACMRIQWAQYP